MIDKDTGEAVTDPAAVRQSDKDVPSWRVSCLMPPGTHPLARCVKGPVVTRSKRKAKAAIGEVAFRLVDKLSLVGHCQQYQPHPHVIRTSLL